MKRELPKKIRDDFMGVAEADKMLSQAIDKLFVDISGFAKTIKKVKRIIKKTK